MYAKEGNPNTFNIGIDREEDFILSESEKETINTKELEETLSRPSVKEFHLMPPTNSVTTVDALRGSKLIVKVGKATLKIEYPKHSPFTDVNDVPVEDDIDLQDILISLTKGNTYIINERCNSNHYEEADDLLIHHYPTS